LAAVETSSELLNRDWQNREREEAGTRGVQQMADLAGALARLALPLEFTH
jgi:hypothetical protein